MRAVAERLRILSLPAKRVQDGSQCGCIVGRNTHDHAARQRNLDPRSTRPDLRFGLDRYAKEDARNALPSLTFERRNLRQRLRCTLGDPLPSCMEVRWIQSVLTTEASCRQTACGLPFNPIPPFQPFRFINSTSHGPRSLRFKGGNSIPPPRLTVPSRMPNSDAYASSEGPLVLGHFA